MIADPIRLIEKHRSTGLLLDTNLLLLFLIGSQDRSLIGKGRLTSYLERDFEILEQFVKVFAKLVTTPHILTEVSNLMGYLPEKSLKRVECFRSFAQSIPLMQEEQIASQAASARSEFAFLGLTDCIIAELADRFFVLSTDALMVVKLNEAGLDAVNFNHFRDELQILT